MLNKDELKTVKVRIINANTLKVICTVSGKFFDNNAALNEAFKNADITQDSLMRGELIISALTFEWREVGDELAETIAGISDYIYTNLMIGRTVKDEKGDPVFFCDTINCGDIDSEYIRHDMSNSTSSAGSHARNILKRFSDELAIKIVDSPNPVYEGE